jgi:preprotein translocase subunit YajC
MILVNALHTLALAQASSPAPAGGAGPAGARGLLESLTSTPLPMFILMFGVLYLLIIRPASKQRKEHQAMLTALKKDDEIITTGGVIGRVVTVEEHVVTVEIADKVKVRVLRDRISGRYTPAAAQSAASATTAQKK